jgi:hypothetical protein
MILQNTNTIFLSFWDCLGLEFLKFCDSNLMVEILQIILKFIKNLAQIINKFQKFDKRKIIQFLQKLFR